MSASRDPIDLQILSIQNDLSKLSEEIDKLISVTPPGRQRQEVGVGIHKKLKLAKNELVEIANDLRASKKRSAELNKAADQVTDISKQMLIEVFDAKEL